MNKLASDLVFKWSADLRSDTYSDSLDIRKEIFVKEQGLPENIEINEWEDRCLYCVGYLDQVPICTCRLMPYGRPGQVKLMRVAVLKAYRKLGVGSQVVQEAVRKASSLNYDQVLLDSMPEARPFYEGLGFSFKEYVRLANNKVHVRMYKCI